MRVDKNFIRKIYRTENPQLTLEVYNEFKVKYNVIHTIENIVVFRHKHRNSDIIIWNINKLYQDGHSHFHSLQVAKLIANNIALNRKPKRQTCIRNLESYIRVGDDNYVHLKFVEDLIETKRDKLRDNYGYHNVGKNKG